VARIVENGPGGTSGFRRSPQNREDQSRVSARGKKVLINSLPTSHQNETHQAGTLGCKQIIVGSGGAGIYTHSRERVRRRAQKKVCTREGNFGLRVLYYTRRARGVTHDNAAGQSPKSYKE